MYQNVYLEDSFLFKASFNVGRKIAVNYKIKQIESSNITAEECMLESQFTFQIPIEYLKLILKNETGKIQSLQCIGKLMPHRESVRQKLIEKHKQSNEFYQNQLTHVESLRHYASFKKSIDKTSSKWEFIATNLHLQRMKVTSSNHSSSSNSQASNFAVYDVTTVGAAANHVRGFKNGGIISHYALASNDTSKPRRKSFQLVVDSLRCKNKERAFEQKLLEIAKLYEKVKNSLIEWSNAASNPHTSVNNFSNLQLSFLQTSIDQFLDSCSDQLVTFSVRHLSEARAGYKPFHGARSDEFFHVSMKGDEVTIGDRTTKWEHLIKNIRTHQDKLERFVQLFIGSDLEAFLQGGESSSEYLQETRKVLSNLDKCLIELYSEACAGLMLNGMNEMEKGKNEINFDLQCRRSSIFSQALSMCACAVVSLITSSLRHNREALEQYANIGIFLQVESLLSTYSNELGMLEDYAVAVYCLTNVTVKCVLHNLHPTNNDPVLTGLPWLEGSAESPILVLPFDDESFHCLPIQLQSGSLIQIVPVIFNVGINEEQALADKFGSSQLQDNINIRSLGDAKEYCSKYKRYFSPKNQPDDSASFDRSSSNKESLSSLLQSLDQTIKMKKRKNVEILRLADAVCRRVNGARVTSCKSAKDRTAMGVTLEQVRILQENHNLDPDEFNTTLERMRRNGTRIENARKNIGTGRYAFSQLQLKTFPRLYRAPDGSYGKAET